MECDKKTRLEKIKNELQNPAEVSVGLMFWTPQNTNNNAFTTQWIKNRKKCEMNFCICVSTNECIW